MRKLVLLVAFIVGITLTGCAAEKSVTTKPSSPSGPAKAGAEETGDDGESNVTKVGQWARAEDGVEFRVSKLKRGTISDIAAGGHPGDPAVIVTVQFKNAGAKRFDLTMVEVKVRLGADGNEAEPVFQEGIDEGLSGTLAPGRSVSDRYMFAASKTGDLKQVSVEIAPGLEYASATFEGSI